MTSNTSAWRDVLDGVTGPLATLSNRLRHNALTGWLLYTGRRSVVTVALLGGVFVAFLGLALLRPVDMEQLLSDTNTLQTLFSAMLSGAILLVSVVSSISSVVLTTEIADIDTEQERIDASIEFRKRTEKLIDTDVTPGRPADFLQVVLATIYDDTQTLRTVAARSDDRAFDEEIQSFTAEVLRETKRAAETLDGARFGTFDVLSAGLNYDYSWQLNTARQIGNQYEDSLSEEESEALSDLVETLKFFATGREHFQSMYYKREVAHLSSMLLYVSLPVIVFISYLLLALDTALVPVVDIGPLSSLAVAVIFAYTISLSPYVVLTAHVIRVAAITLQNLDAGPFMVRQREDRDVVELDLDIDPDEWESPDTDGDDLQ